MFVLFLFFCCFYSFFVVGIIKDVGGSFGTDHGPFFIGIFKGIEFW